MDEREIENAIHRNRVRGVTNTLLLGAIAGLMARWSEDPKDTINELISALDPLLDMYANDKPASETIADVQSFFSETAVLISSAPPDR